MKALSSTPTSTENSAQFFSGYISRGSFLQVTFFFSLNFCPQLLMGLLKINDDCLCSLILRLPCCPENVPGNHLKWDFQDTHIHPVPRPLSSARLFLGSKSSIIFQMPLASKLHLAFFISLLSGFNICFPCKALVSSHQ